MQTYLDTARDAARQAGALIRENFGQAQQITHKGRIDLVTAVDQASEELLRRLILTRHPNHAILGEEQGATGPAGQPLWIVDPLDGTRSFAHGYPFVCVSIGLEIDGQLEVGVVYDPLREELFEAVRGQGARLNGRPIRVSANPLLEQALLVTGFPYHLAEFDNAALFELFRVMVVSSGGIRRDGSAALDFCYLAAGRLDGYWEFFLKPWDAAAGSLIAREAGATVSNLDGSPYDIRGQQLLASNGLIHQAMLELARPFTRQTIPGVG